MGWLNWRCLLGRHDWLIITDGPFGRRICDRCGSEQERRWQKWRNGWHWCRVTEGPRR